ncbi:membrane protein DedA, SNARE-associated domain [Thermanaeromonas toyohensis ToBE]|uniref:Membrane protein DedA, SNARE-associated domain n=1 Tax=Thermanaeromonas toyohensis ToBE TaxID=698762 RepID=A0A1W1VKS8_9FIRM|nr:DedA family protein [Thermanaeromonas toyohensis]SMB93574.1 membrane protein DedA, SNARE-associated domain [Thermanaeromonas toyohensis ToBE]
MENIIAAVLQTITATIAAFGYWGIGAGMAIESACIPLPSEVILPFGGYLVSTGRLEFWATVLAGTLGGTLGSIIAYLVGLWGGRPFLKKYGRYVFFSEKEFAAAERWFNRYGEFTVFFTRLLPVIRTFISLPAGIANMPFWRFVVYTFLGSLPWSIALVYAGQVLGSNWEALAPLFHRFDAVIGVAILALLFFYLWHRQHRS